MPVQHEVKSQLAKLLATEDLVVEHKNVPSAQFNVHTRVLILPVWEKASSVVYDMLVGHEVGHALFTPDEWDFLDSIPQQFVNVVEDARIEKLMKRKYLGIAKSFYKGYNEMYEQDFFELDGQDINSLNLADRANLYFKIGSFLSLAFSPTEKSIINLIHDCETFEDTLSAAEALYNFCKQEPQEKEDGKDHVSDTSDSGNNNIGSATDNTSPLSDDRSSSSMEDRSDSSSSNDRVDDSDPVVETADKLESKLRDLVDAGGVENEYIEVQKVNLDTIIAGNEEVHRYIDNYWVETQKFLKQESYNYTHEIQGALNIDTCFDEVDSEFYKFKKDARKEVSYLVKEFECRKSASAYSRSATSRTGVLDTTKLQTYRFSEDLFKKVTILPDGKNHGLVFILDWSGSMQYVLDDTLKQLYNLLWFCKKVQIPFDVYAFTQEWSRPDRYQLKSHYERREGVFKIEDEFNLMNIFTSKVNLKTLESQMVNIWRVALAFKRRVLYCYPDRMVLSGTPLNESLISLHQILPLFQKENGVEKVQCIILTDGEAHPLPYHKTVQRNWESEPYLGCRQIKPDRCFLRDRKVGKVYKFKYYYHEFTNILLKNLKDNFPDTNFIGIRVLSPRDAKGFMRLYNEDVEKDWKKNKSFMIKTSGYDAYFGMSSTTLSQDSEFEVEEDATNAQIKRAFVKSLKTKKLNKKVLGQFIELVV